MKEAAVYCNVFEFEDRLKTALSVLRALDVMWKQQQLDFYYSDTLQ